MAFRDLIATTKPVELDSHRTVTDGDTNGPAVTIEETWDQTMAVLHVHGTGSVTSYATLDVTVEVQDDDGTWQTAGTFAQIQAETGAFKARVDRSNWRDVRVTYTVNEGSDTGASYDVSVVLVGEQQVFG